MSIGREWSKGCGLAAASLAALALLLAFHLRPEPVSGATPAVDRSQSSTADRLDLPVVGEALPDRIAVLSAPRAGARRLAVMRALRFDYRPTAFYISAQRIDRRGVEWLRVDVPGRPNGRRGWVRADQIRILRSVGPFEIRVSVSKRRLVLLRNGRRVLWAPVAIGKPGAPTPRGRFYVTAAFGPNDPFLGPWALEISAYGAVTDWPQGGIVGLHGTNLPQLIGQPVSSGCIRVRNGVILALKKWVKPGAPFIITG